MDNLVTGLKQHIRGARVLRETDIAIKLNTVLSEAQAIAKAELRELTEDDVSKTAEKFIRNLRKTLDVVTDPVVEASIFEEIELYHDYVIVDPLASLSLIELIEHFSAENENAHEKKIAGLVMRTTKGKYKMDEVLEAIRS